VQAAPSQRRPSQRHPSQCRPSNWTGRPRLPPPHQLRPLLRHRGHAPDTPPRGGVAPFPPADESSDALRPPLAAPGTSFSEAPDTIPQPPLSARPRSSSWRRSLIDDAGGTPSIRDRLRRLANRSNGTLATGAFVLGYANTAGSRASSRLRRVSKSNAATVVPRAPDSFAKARCKPHHEPFLTVATTLTRKSTTRPSVKHQRIRQCVTRYGGACISDSIEASDAMPPTAAAHSARPQDLA
jgi:hypothetical protein